MAFLVTTQISQTETWLRQKSERRGVAQKAKLYLEPTKWGQVKIIAKGKICPCYVQGWYHMPPAVPGHGQPDQHSKCHNRETLGNFPHVSKEQDLGSR